MTTGTTQSMTARTMPMTTRTVDPLRENPIVSAVASIRAMQDDLTPRQRQIRENGRRRVDALVASGLYAPIPL